MSYPTIRSMLRRRLLAQGPGLERPSKLDFLQGPHRRDASGGPPLLPQAAPRPSASSRGCAQRHGFSGSYSTVQRYMKERFALRAEGRVSDTRMGPGHHAGRLRAGRFRLCLRRRQARMHYLPMSFPYSTTRCARSSRTRKDVCVCQGLKGLLRAHRGVPGHRGFDNATDTGEEVARTRSWSPTSSAGSGCTTASRHASATRTPARRRETSRARSATPGGTSSCPCPRWMTLQDYNRGLAETLDAHSEKAAPLREGTQLGRPLPG